MISTKELDELKKLAGANLDAALMAAARIGATKSTEACKPIKRAIHMLEFDAECLKNSHTVAGNWGNDTAAKQEYDEMKKLIKQLRELVKE